MQRKKLVLLYASLITAMVIWATSFFWSKIALETFSSFTIVFFRLIISTFILLIFLFAAKKITIIERKHIPIFILLGFFEPFLYFTGETTGLNYVSPPIAAIVIAIIPLFTPFAALFFLRERLSVLNLLGISVSFIGILLVVFEKGMKLLVAWEGLLLLFLAVISAVAYSVIVKKIPKKYSVVNIVLYQNIVGIMFFLPIVLIFFKDNIIETGYHKEAFSAILKLGVFASTAAFILFLFALRNLPITNVNVFTNTIPIITLIVSWLFLKETLLLQQVIGIGVVIVGVIISQMRLKSYKRKIETHDEV